MQPVVHLVVYNVDYSNINTQISNNAVNDKKVGTKIIVGVLMNFHFVTPCHIFNASTITLREIECAIECSSNASYRE